MKKTILILALMLVAITAVGAMTPAPHTSGSTLSADTGNYIYYAYHHYWGYRYYAPRVYVAPVVPVYRVWYTHYYYWY
jgi:hypothetical protein